MFAGKCCISIGRSRTTRQHRVAKRLSFWGWQSILGLMMGLIRGSWRKKWRKYPTYFKYMRAKGARFCMVWWYGPYVLDHWYECRIARCSPCIPVGGSIWPFKCLYFVKSYCERSNIILPMSSYGIDDLGKENHSRSTLMCVFERQANQSQADRRKNYWRDESEW